MKQTVVSIKVIVLQKKTFATKCNDNRTFSFGTHTAKLVARILRRRKERNLRIHVETRSLDIEGENDAEKDITTNCGHR